MESATQAEAPAPGTEGLNTEIVDPMLMAQLVSELQRVLDENAGNRTVQQAYRYQGDALPDVTKYVATPPLNSVTLDWNYQFPGDYDLNGEVNIGDLTPVGIHFGKTVTLEYPPFLVDGDGNGEINLADITPIGLNYGKRIEGFEILAATNPAGPWDSASSIAYDDTYVKLLDARRWYQVSFWDQPYTEFQVRPWFYWNDTNQGPPLTGDSCTALIGPDGGYLYLNDGAVLIVPAGAMQAEETLELTRMSYPFDEAEGFHTYRLQGASLPAEYTLSYPAEAGLDPADFTAARFDEEALSMDPATPTPALGDSLPFIYDDELGMVTASLARSTSRVTNDNGTASETIVLELKPVSTFCTSTRTVMLEVPFYAQVVDGACAPACMAMALKGLGCDHEVYELCKKLGFPDDPGDSFTGWGVNTLSPVGSTIWDLSKTSFEAFKTLNRDSFLKKITDQIDHGHPVFVPIPKHMILVVGYKVEQVDQQTTFSLIYHNPTDDLVEGGMYTEKTFADFIKVFYENELNLFAEKTYVYTWGIALGPLVTPGVKECTMGVPDKVRGSKGFIEFDYAHPASGANVPIHFNWLPTAENGYKWKRLLPPEQFYGVTGHEPLPNYLKNLKLKLPCWNVSGSPINAILEVAVPMTHNPGQNWLLQEVPVVIPAKGHEYAELDFPASGEPYNVGNLARLVNYDAVHAEMPAYNAADPFVLQCRLLDDVRVKEYDEFSLTFDLQDPPVVEIFMPSQDLQPGMQINLNGLNYGSADTYRRRVVFEQSDERPALEAVITDWGEGLLTATVPDVEQVVDQTLPCVIRLYPEEAQSNACSVSIAPKEVVVYTLRIRIELELDDPNWPLMGESWIYHGIPWEFTAVYTDESTFMFGGTSESDTTERYILKEMSGTGTGVPPGPIEVSGTFKEEYHLWGSITQPFDDYEWTNGSFSTTGTPSASYTAGETTMIYYPDGSVSDPKVRGPVNGNTSKVDASMWAN